MTKAKEIERNKKLVEYRKYHSRFETALHFDLSVGTVSVIMRKWRKTNGNSG